MVLLTSLDGMKGCSRGAEAGTEGENGGQGGVWKFWSGMPTAIWDDFPKGLNPNPKAWFFEARCCATVS